MDLDALLEKMLQLEGSELFLAAGKCPCARVRGALVDLAEEPHTAADLESLMEALLDEAQHERYRVGGSVSAGYASARFSRRFRLNFHRRLGQPGAVARVLAEGSVPLADLGLPATVLRLADFPSGLVLIAGVGGSGRSTTLAGIVHQINRTRAVHLVTLEDPVEFVHQDFKARVSQREVGVDVNSLEAGLKDMLQESPDVILLDEIRDGESCRAALAWALSGRLVFSTVLGADVVHCLQSLVDLLPERQRDQLCAELSLCVKAILVQKLVPTREGKRLIPACELMVISPEVARMIRDQRLEELKDILKGSNESGMFSFNQSLAALHKSGLISAEMGLVYCTDETEFRSAVGGTRSVAPGRWDLKALMARAVERGASDLHLSVGRPPIMRVGGELERLKLPLLTARDIRSMLFAVLTGTQRGQFERDKELDCSLTLDGGVRFRVNAYFQKGCVAAALRTIPSTVPGPSVLRLPEALVRLATRPHGLVLVVGPTGSGKTTTVACLVDQINRTRACHIITVEDPIEYSHESVLATIDQREVYADTRTFSSALKYVLRQDPDVIMVGEMRDLETISAVLTAAETGHLVFATLHTNDACQTIDRVVDVFPPHQQGQIRQQLAASLLGVVSQRLLARADQRGRVAAFELMIATPAIRALVREGKSHQMGNVISTSLHLGMVTLDRSLARLFQAGLVTFDEAARFVSDPEILRSQEQTASSSA